MARFEVRRRAVLKGAGGAALALPALEIMVASLGRTRAARAAAAQPKRFVMCYGGISIGGFSAPWDYVTPTTTGAAYETTIGSKPLEDLKVKSEVGIVSGLKIPWGPATGLPPGGRTVGFHYSTKVPQISGLKNATRSEKPSGPTADQLVADVIAGGTPHRSLSFRVQPVTYLGHASMGDTGRLSWDKNRRAIEPIVSPRLAFQTLFGEAPPAATTATSSAGSALLARRKSILDVVKDSTRDLMVRLGQEDRARMQRYADELRDLETRIDALSRVGASGGCRRPAAPEDPPIGANLYNYVEGEKARYSTTAAWSDEDKRAQILCDFIALAFACDLTRVASVLFTQTQATVNMYPINGAPCDMHGTGHSNPGGSNRNCAVAVSWHVKHFATLVAKLRDTRDVDGSSLIDHSALVLFFEGGHGRDPEGDAKEESYLKGLHSSHSTENMVVFVAGRAGGLKSGQHLKAADKHPAQVVLTAMNAVGAPGPLGDITAPIPELLR